jgi:hypothetical protein
MPHGANNSAAVGGRVGVVTFLERIFLGMMKIRSNEYLKV